GSYERGVWAVALLISSIVSLLSEMGLGLAMFSVARREPARRAAARTVAVLLALFAGLVATGAVLLWIRHGTLPIVGNIPTDVLVPALASVVLTNLLSVT